MPSSLVYLVCLAESTIERPEDSQRDCAALDARRMLLMHCARETQAGKFEIVLLKVIGLFNHLMSL